jgi:hypothetical protein
MTLAAGVEGWTAEQLAAALYGSMIVSMGHELPTCGPFAALEPWQRDHVLSVRRCDRLLERGNDEAWRSIKGQTSRGDTPWDGDCFYG